ADLGDAAVAALSRWRDQWRARPEIVASLQLTDRPAPVEPVADRIAEVGRLERVSLPVPRGPAPGRDASGAQEAAHWLDAIDAGP
ncbi:ATP-dependent DNA helicase RecQ, partial [Tsukamurella tyrosinosolvens]